MDILSYLAEHFDLPILDWIAANLWCPFLDAVMPVITLLGDAGIFWIAIAVVLLFFPKTRRIGLGMGAALLLGLLVCNVTLKPLVARIRPYDYVLEQFGVQIKLLIEAQHDFSFPSGHTIASFEAATVLLIHSKKAGVPAVVLACLIAFSRLYLYVHYPTDVIASVVLGVAFGFLGNWLVKKGFDVYEARRLKA
ncbi:MAG: phosphatase PAP2 family protein [Oscillospiraceae bacterium]|nr:phosphatase PAP2 family protein [Oscillospiraceae bacterium]